MKRALLLLMTLLLSGCVSQPGNDALPKPTSSATPDPYLIALGQAQAQATKQALDATSMAIEVALTQTAIAPTLHAGATATERAWQVIGWTATAEAWTPTPTPEPTITPTPTPNFTATIDAAAAAAKATALYVEAQSAELAAERERMMNKVWAVTPWAGLVASIVFVLLILWQREKMRIVARDDRGDAPLLIIGGKIYDADRNPYPLLDISASKPQIPALTPPELQAATTARDQMIDLATRSAPGDVSQRKAVAQKMAALPASSRQQIKVLPPEQVRPFLGDVIPNIVKDAIEIDLNDEEA